MPRVTTYRRIITNLRYREEELVDLCDTCAEAWRLAGENLRPASAPHEGECEENCIERLATQAAAIY